MRFAVLASGNGSNFEAIATAWEQKQIPGELALVFANHPEAYVLERAAQHQIPHFSFTVKESGGKEAYEKALLHLLQEQKIDFVILAGYLRILGKEIIEAFPERILNIHPSLLPSFPGLHGIQDAFNYGVKVTGVTVHFVDCGLDTGPIIAQEVVPISPEDTLATLEAKIHQVEHQLYPRIIGECLEKENHS